MNRITLPLTIIVAFYATIASAQSVQYTVTNLGTLGGPNPFSEPTGINSYGQVTGTADGIASGTGYAFLWTSPGPIVSLGALGSQPTQSNATGINDSSWVVGESNNEAFLYTPQTGMQGLGFLSGGTNSEAYSLNNAGTVVGGATTLGGSQSNAFIWDPINGMRDLNSMVVNPPNGWTPTGATVINQNGVIAGIGYSDVNTSPPSGTEHAFTVSGNSLTAIPALGIGVYPKGMNASGEVVGLSFDANHQERAFVYTPAGGIHDIGTLGGPGAVAFDVNDLGEVVGGADLTDGDNDAFLYTEADGMVDLNTLAPVEGWTLDTASAINDTGQIVAQGYDGQDYSTFLLTPKTEPEPSTFCLLLAMGSGVLAVRARRIFNGSRYLGRRECESQDFQQGHV